METMTQQETGILQQIRQMVSGLVDNEGAVGVTPRREDGKLVVDVTVDPADIGKVIGKQGRTARSLRTILNAAAMKHRLRCEMNIIPTPEVGD